jgi:hypothetical protein
VNFLRRLALQEKKLDDSSRLDVVEIARVPEHASELVSFLVGLRTYQHPVLIVFAARTQTTIKAFNKTDAEMQTAFEM